MTGVSNTINKLVNFLTSPFESGKEDEGLFSELQDEFGITITPADIIPENFNSAKALWAMVERLQEA